MAIFSMFFYQVLAYQEKALNLHFQCLRLSLKDLERVINISVLVIWQKSF